MAEDKVFDLLHNLYYCKENKTYRFILLFLKTSDKNVGTYPKNNANVFFYLFSR